MLEIGFRCLLENQPFRYAFKVKTSWNDEVGDLKEIIKKKMGVTLEGINACDLTLWSASIPFGNEDAIPEFKLNGKQDNVLMLSTFDKISRKFPARKRRCIHIIVQLPSL
jgi:Crinkler effector protein N-terminal domain